MIAIPSKVKLQVTLWNGSCPNLINAGCVRQHQVSLVQLEHIHMNIFSAFASLKVVLLPSFTIFHYPNYSVMISFEKNHCLCSIFTTLSTAWPFFRVCMCVCARIRREFQPQEMFEFCASAQIRKRTCIHLLLLEVQTHPHISVTIPDVSPTHGQCLHFQLCNFDRLYNFWIWIWILPYCSIAPTPQGGLSNAHFCFLISVMGLGHGVPRVARLNVPQCVSVALWTTGMRACHCPLNRVDELIDIH